MKMQLIVVDEAWLKITHSNKFNNLSVIITAFLLCCSTNLELSYTYCYQRLTITWLLQTSPQNSQLCLAI